VADYVRAALLIFAGSSQMALGVCEAGGCTLSPGHDPLSLSERRADLAGLKIFLMVDAATGGRVRRVRRRRVCIRMSDQQILGPATPAAFTVLLSDPQLRVEELARRHRVSVRHVCTLFDRIGTTPGAYLREQRLLTAQAMLPTRGMPGSGCRTSLRLSGFSASGRSSRRSGGSTG